MPTQADKALGLLERDGVLRPRDLRREGIPNIVVKRLLERGLIQRVVSNTGPELLLGYSLHGVAAGPSDADHSRLAQIAVQHPAGVLCLQSALRFHRMTDEFQTDFYVAVQPGSTHRSQLPGVKFIQWSNPLQFKLGVVTESLGGVACRITDPSRTVADLFQPHRDEFRAERMGALSHLMQEHGRQAVNKAMEYAVRLGWKDEFEGPLQGFVEGLKCSPEPPKP